MPATQVRLPTQEEDPLAPLLPIALGDISFTSLQLKKILQNGGAFQVVPGKGIRSIIDNQWPIETLKKRVVWVKEEGEIDGYWLDGSLSLCRELNQLERSNRLASISWHPTQEDTHEARIYINQKPTKWHICLLSTESEYRKWIRICQLKRWAKEYLSGESSPIFFPHPTKIQYMILAKGPLHSTPFNSRLDWDFFKVWNDQTTTEPPQLTKLAQQLQRRLILMKAEIHHPLPNAALRWFDNPPRRGNAYFIRMKAKDWEEEKEFCATYEPWNELSYFRHRKYRRWLTAAAADS